MKKAIYLILGFILFNFHTFSQTPGVHWQRNLGIAGSEDYFLTVKTNDNGIISVWNKNDGMSGLIVAKFGADGIRQWQKNFDPGYSVESAVSYVYNSDGSLVILARALPPFGIYDYYIIKIDSNGNKVWENYFGGFDLDVASSIIKSAGGGYLITGNELSTDGNVTGNHGNVDAWVLKVDESGGLVWQKALGGSSNEGQSKYEGRGKLVEGSDGSVYMLTETSSNDGDVTGNHGGQDLWLVKLNSAGVGQWAKCLGGTSNEFIGDLKLSPSGDLIVFGTSSSPELTTNGATQLDYYFARVSQAGVVLFQKCFGSTGSDAGLQIASVESDESCVLTGYVTKGDGDVTGFHGASASDIWVIKINSGGTILWQKAIGGTGTETIVNIDILQPVNSVIGGAIKANDGGYFISAQTNSNDGDISGAHLGQDMLGIKLSSSGVLDWTRTIGGASNELPKGLPIELGPNEFVMGGVTFSSDGDIQRYYGTGDPWLVKLGPVNTIKGILFLDQNNNGIKDAGEPLFSDARVIISKGVDSRTVVPNIGNFYLTTDTGSFVTTVSFDHPYYNVVPINHNSSFSTYFNRDSFSFAVQPIPGMKDLVVDATPLYVARPGFLADYKVQYRNVGNVTVPSGQVLFKKDARMSLFSSTPAISSSVGDTLKWDVGTLTPGSSGTILLSFQMASPPTLNIGDTLISLALITPLAGDVTPNDDSAIVKQITRGSFDPNDKAENHSGNITPTQVASGEYLGYVVRFQNTGTDTAFNITVRDTLDNKLAWSTFEMIGASHPYQLQINNSNQLVWTFSNINLPHSAINEPASHGYIAYRIKPASNVQIGNTISNKASIYFDFNLPVETNIAATIVGTPIALPLHLVTFDAKYEKPDAFLEWSTADESNVDKFVIERGTDPVHFVPVSSVAAKGNSNSITRYQLKDGLATTSGDKFYYRLKMVDQDQKFTYSNIQLVKREGRAGNELVVNPNPVKGRFGFAWINLQKETRAEIGVVDMKGNYRSLGQHRVNKGFNVVPLDFFRLSAGTYLLEVKIGQERLVSRFVLVQ